MSEPPRRLHAITAAAGRLDRSAALAKGLAAAFAGTAFDPADPVLAGVCTTGRTLVLRTGALPVPMQREISWWVATCHADGERVINTCDWNRWVATALEVIGERPKVCSFADLSLAEWTAAWARKFHADIGRLASASTRYRAECAIRGLLRRLAIQYSDAPWWTHDVWCLRAARRARSPRSERTCLSAWSLQSDKLKGVRDGGLLDDWEIYLTDEVRDWISGLDARSHQLVVQAVDILAERGPALGRPLVDHVEHSSVQNLKELRPGSSGRSELRVLFVFDPWRSAILLVAGDKSGNWRQWYREAIPRAEHLLEVYLKERAEEEGRN